MNRFLEFDSRLTPKENTVKEGETIAYRFIRAELHLCLLTIALIYCSKLWRGLCANERGREEKLLTLQGDALGLGAVGQGDCVIGVADRAEQVLPPPCRRVGHDAGVELDDDGARVATAAAAAAAGLEEDGGVAALERGVEALHDPGPPALERRLDRRRAPEGDLLQDIPGLQRRRLPAGPAPLLRLAAPRHALDRHHRRASPAVGSVHFHRASTTKLQSLRLFHRQKSIFSRNR